MADERLFLSPGVIKLARATEATLAASFGPGLDNRRLEELRYQICGHRLLGTPGYVDVLHQRELPEFQPPLGDGGMLDLIVRVSAIAGFASIPRI